MKKILLTLLAAVPLCAGCLYYAYPGFVGDLLADLRYSSPAEIKAKYSFFYYYASFYEKLKVNPETGFYDMSLAIREYENRPGRNDFELAKLNFHQGNFAAAVKGVEADIAKHGESESKLFWLAMSYLRLAEAENCLARLGPGAQHAAHHAAAPPDLTRSCSLPITIFQDKREGTEAAARALKKLLDEYDRDNRLYRWLLNFCYMATDRFPAGVPPEYLIQSDFIDSFYGAKKREAEARFSHLSFRDRARELGVATLDAGKGVAVEDFDSDGDLDIVTGGTFSRLMFYRNESGRGFTERAHEAGLGAATQAYMISAADYDNDGRVDIFVGRPFHRFILYRNEGDGTFTDATISSGLLPGEPGADEALYTCVSTWADVNNDGHLDLFLAQFGQRLPFVGGLLARRPMTSRLFVNERGHFTDRTDEYGLGPVVADTVFIGAAFGDYDSDGWPDLFLSSVSRGRSVLLRNVGGRSFERTALAGEEPGFTAAFVDVDQDGRLDIFQGSQGIAAADTARAVFGDNPTRNNNRIFLQERGGFRARPDLFGGGMSIGTMGSSYGDINNDGCADFYLGTKTPEGWNILPNLMYVGETEGTRCTGRLANITMLNGFGTVQKGHAIVFFDFDDDGDEDIYSSLGGMWPGDEWPNQLFVNESRQTGAWLKVRLRGRRTNRFGVGARIRVSAEGAGGEEIVRFYQMDQKTGFGSAPYVAHVGLMGAARVREIQVFWPASNQTRSYAGRLGALNVLDEAEGVASAAGRQEGGE